MADSPETPRRSSRKVVLHRCPHCDKGYERPDHLARHLDSRGYSIREKQEATPLIVGQIEMSESISVRRVIVDSIDGRTTFSLDILQPID